jgi:hypothetical protein
MLVADGRCIEVGKDVERRRSKGYLLKSIEVLRQDMDSVDGRDYGGCARPSARNESKAVSTDKSLPMWKMQIVNILSKLHTKNKVYFV